MTGLAEILHPPIAHRRARRDVSVALAAMLLGAGLPAYPQTLEVVPDAAHVVVFSGRQGGPFSPQSDPKWILSNSEASSLDFSILSSQPWLTVTITGGTVPASLLNREEEAFALLTAEANNLAPGVYTGEVTFTNLTNGQGTTTRQVELQVAPASIAVSPAFINVSATSNGPNPADAVITLTNDTTVDLNFELHWTQRPWLGLSAESGTVPGGDTVEVFVSFNLFGLSNGLYASSVEVRNTTNGAGTREVPINLLVEPATAGAILLLPDTDVDADGPAASIPAASQTYELSNLGSEPFPWIAEATEDWVTITPASGWLASNNGAAGGPDQQFVDIRLNAARNDLPAGAHTAMVTILEVWTNPFTGAVSTFPAASRIVRVEADPVLTLSLPQSGGTVTATPPGRTATASTTQNIRYEFGDTVTLTASINDGHQFGGWSANFDIDDPMVNPLVLIMDESKHVSAIIKPVTHTLTLSTNGVGTGTVTASPTATIVENALVSKYEHGVLARLTATADNGAVFVGWSGNIPSGAQLLNPLEVIMDRDRTITARFERGLSVAVDITGDGDVLVAPNLVSYAPGTVVTLTASAADGYVFAGWSGGATGTDETITVTLNQSLVVAAEFIEISGGNGGGNMAKLTVDVEGDGQVTPPGGNFARGAKVTLIATPGVGSRFVGWEADATGDELATVITMDGDRSVRAVFDLSDEPAPQPAPGGGQVCGAMGMLGLPMLMGLGLVFLSPPGRRAMRASAGVET